MGSAQPQPHPSMTPWWSSFALTLTVELFAKGANGKLRMRRPIYDSPSVTDPAADIAATKGASQTITVEDASTP